MKARLVLALMTSAGIYPGGWDATGGDWLFEISASCAISTLPRARMASR